MWDIIGSLFDGPANNYQYKLYGFFGGALSDITEMMVVIRTYDKLYDERGDSSWKASDMVAELFKQIRNVYSAILDFSFSVKQHITAGKMCKLSEQLNLFAPWHANYPSKNRPCYQRCSRFEF